MFIHLDRERNEKYIYQQIYETIKNQILNKQIESHEKLPSKRLLATQLQVSLNTVALAFEQLLAEGYIYTIERKGYFVEDLQNFDFDIQIERVFPEDLKEEPKNKDGWLSLSHMSTDITYFPFKSWTKYQVDSLNLFQKELCEMPDPQGPYIVRQTIAKLIRSTRGVICEPEQIIIHATSQNLLEQLIFLQAKEKTIFALENPGYARYYQLLKRHGVPTEIIALDQNGVDIKQLTNSKSQFLITTPSHQFPTGKIMPISRRIELLNWAVEQPDRYIIEDDYDSEFKYKTDHVPSLQSLDHNQRVIYMGTFSKTLLPGIRISYMILPPKLLRKHKEHFSSLIQSSNVFSLYTLQQFIESGTYQKHVRKMNHHYESVRSVLIENLQEVFRDKIEIDNTNAGLHFLMKVNTSKTYAEIEAAAQEQKLELYTIPRFLLVPEPNYLLNRYVIIGFANIALEKIEEALARLQKVLF